jgi:hypothetical protein
VGAPTHHDVEALVVVVAANFAFRHVILPRYEQLFGTSCQRSAGTIPGGESPPG